MNPDTRKLLRRAQRGPGHAMESRRLRAAMPPMLRAVFDPGFHDERIPGTLLEVSLAHGASLDLAPLHSAWIDTCNTRTFMVMPKPLPGDVDATRTRVCGSSSAHGGD
jgi:hypothetical protein